MIEHSPREAMEHAPLVSVLMLAYKHERYIAQAIEGVLAQKCDFRIELVVGEDCSPDATRSIIERYQAEHRATIRLITGDKNVGAVANFYRTLEYCRGRFIAFCEGDDYWTDESKLRLQVEALEARPQCDLCFHSDFYEYVPSGTQAGPMRRVASRDCLIGVKEVLAGGGAYMPSASLVMRVEILRSLPAWVRHDNGVIDIYMQAYGAQRGGAYYIDRPMAIYRIGDSGSWNVMTASNADREIAFRKLRLKQVAAMADDFPAHRRLLFDTLAAEILGAYRRAAQIGDHRLSTFCEALLEELVPQLSTCMRFRIALSRSRLVGSHWRRFDELSQINIGRFRKILIKTGFQ